MALETLMQLATASIKNGALPIGGRVLPRYLDISPLNPAQLFDLRQQTGHGSLRGS
jgi:hypothetical protein